MTLRLIKKDAATFGNLSETDNIRAEEHHSVRRRVLVRNQQVVKTDRRPEVELSVDLVFPDDLNYTCRKSKISSNEPVDSHFVP